jgi:hypothetical protein
MVPAVSLSPAATLEDINRWFASPERSIFAIPGSYDFAKIRRLLGDEFANWNNVAVLAIGRHGISIMYDDLDMRTLSWKELMP